ncbi:response regulator transcription factor [Tumebacillus sp. ITR2]|uniref:Response regulator transcription factor n=1 Tax=Tumebacillus amylolyticus TaxID=2801339 RepID=A0ABS1JDR9_9BACL|nr:response regulator transcription factor [Tumebacillus amylolyticus]MBL0388432.1 response regulator transcription factor [Tumebacillus amylolyticus]
MRILLVEDDRPLLDAIRQMFEEDSYAVDTAEHGDDGLMLAEQGIYDLIVLDIMLPGTSGLDILQHLRKRGLATPILLLTARDTVEDRVRGLDAGADDYLVKPFAVAELLARARALLRRNGSVNPDGELTYGRLSIRPKSRDGYVDNQPLKLTAKEYKLFEFLLVNREQILTREQIFDRVWGFEVETNTSVVDVYLHYLRKKLAVHSCDHLIQTVRGVGCILKGTS